MQFHVMRPAGHLYGTTEYSKYKRTDCDYAPKCATCGKYIGCIQWLPPYRVRLETWERRFDDVVYGPGDIFLVSEHFIEMWRREEFIGITAFEPVEVVKVRRHKAFQESPPPYSRVTIPYGGPAMDVDKSEFIYEGGRPLCKDCLTGPLIKSIRALRVNEATWEGQDVFRLRGCPGDFVVTDIFINKCNSYGITNLDSIPIEEFSWRVTRGD